MIAEYLSKILLVLNLHDFIIHYVLSLSNFKDIVMYVIFQKRCYTAVVENYQNKMPSEIQFSFSTHFV